MPEDRFAAIEALYHAARARPAADRAAFLAEACAGDADLAREVESLLETRDDQPALEQLLRSVG